MNTFLGRYRGVLVNRSASPEAAFSDTLQVPMSQHSVRELPLTAATLDQIDPFKSYDFYKDRFSDASGFTFVFVGNFKLDSMKPWSRKWLAPCRPPGKGNLRTTGIRPPKGVVQRIVKKAPSRRHGPRSFLPVHFEYTSQKSILSERSPELLNIKLRDALRENLGGTYG